MSSLFFPSTPCKIPLFSTSTLSTNSRPKLLCQSSSTSPSFSTSSSALSPSLPPSVLTFWKWLVEEGVVSPLTCPVKPAFVPEGLGLVATRDIEKDEFLVKVPRRLWVNPGTVAASEIGYLCEDLKPWVAVSLFLAREKERGSSSPWRLYVDILPEKTNSTIFWSEEEFSEIKETLLLRMTMEMKEHVESEFRKVEEAIIIPNKHLFPSSLTLETFLWAFGMIRSRAFSRLSGQLAMLPLVDLINHSSKINKEDNAVEMNGPAGLFSWDLLFCLKSTIPVKEGEQVFIQYGLKKSNADLALYYGFVESDSGRDSYTLTFSIPESDTFCVEKLEIATANGSHGTAYFDIFIDHPQLPEMLQYLRLVALDEADAFLLEPVFRNSVWRALESPVSRLNEEIVCRMVRDACRSALSGYHTTIEQDESLIQGGNLDPKLEIAVRVRLGEKRVLQQIEEAFKERELRLDEFDYYHERRPKELGLVVDGGEIFCQPKKDSIPSL